VRMHQRSKSRPGWRRGERGYIMMTLLLMVAIMMIFTAAILPTIKYQIEHDREEEMIHRGVQYTRAVRAYYRKFGAYPMKLEDLENTNQMRFLRKRYKDPTTGKDFKLLHYSDVALSGGMVGSTIAGATPVSAMAGQNGAGGPSSFGTSSFGQSSFGQSPTGQSSFGQSSFGQSSFGQSSSTFGNTPGGIPTNGSTSATGQTQSAETTASSTQVTNAPGSTGNDDSQDSLKQVGAGPIVGVASTSKKTGYREFNHKKKYNEWQFIYDPANDTGFLPMTPNQPVQMPQPANVNGTSPNGQNGVSSGTNSSFGNGGMQNNLGTSPTGGFGNPGAMPNQPNNPPQQ
jgi:type II secretory pathway pseudopilin PulG